MKNNIDKYCYNFPKIKYDEFYDEEIEKKFKYDTFDIKGGYGKIIFLKKKIIKQIKFNKKYRFNLDHNKIICNDEALKQYILSNTISTIPKIKNVYFSDHQKFMYIVMERLTNWNERFNDLFSLKDLNLQKYQFLYTLFDIIYTLLYLQDQYNFYHNDLYTRNILFRKLDNKKTKTYSLLIGDKINYYSMDIFDYEVVLSDFGISSFENEKYNLFYKKIENEDLLKFLFEILNIFNEKLEKIISLTWFVDFFNYCFNVNFNSNEYFEINNYKNKCSSSFQNINSYNNICLYLLKYINEINEINNEIETNLTFHLTNEVTLYMLNDYPDFIYSYFSIFNFLKIENSYIFFYDIQSMKKNKNKFKTTKDKYHPKIFMNNKQGFSLLLFQEFHNKYKNYFLQVEPNKFSIIKYKAYNNDNSFPCYQVYKNKKVKNINRLYSHFLFFQSNKINGFLIKNSLYKTTTPIDILIQLFPELNNIYSFNYHHDQNPILCLKNHDKKICSDYQHQNYYERLIYYES